MPIRGSGVAAFSSSTRNASCEITTLPRFGTISLLAISSHAGSTGLFSRLAAAIASSKMVRAEMFVNIALSEGDLRSAIPIEARISYSRAVW